MTDEGRASAFTGAVKALRDIMKLRKRIIVSDNPELFVRQLINDGLPTYAEEALDKIQNSLKGAFVIKGKGDVSYIFINPKFFARRDMAGAIKVLSHELGHMFFDQHWGDTTNEQRKALMDAFETFLEGNPKFRESLSYERRFEEWLADQVAAWVASNKEPRNAVERWFKDLADMFKRIWSAIQDRFPLDLTVNEYINETLRTFDSKIDPSLESLGAANSVFYDDITEPVRQPTSWARELWTKARAMKAKYPTINKMTEFVSKSAIAMHNGFSSRVQARIRRMGIQAFNEIMDRFHLRAGDKGGFTFDTAVNNRMQNFQHRYNQIINRVKNQSGFLEALRSEQAIDQMPQEFREPAAQMRNLMRSLYEYQVEAGLPISEVPHYFPQVGDVAELSKPDAIDVIFNEIQRSGVRWNTPRGEIDITREMVEGWVQSLGDDTFAVNFDPTKLTDVSANAKLPFHQALRERVLQPQVRAVIRDIKDANGQSRFYAKDINQVMHRYIRQAARRAEYNRILGEDVRLIPPSEKDPRQLSRPWNPHGKLEQLMAKAQEEQGADGNQVQLMYDALAAFMGNYNRIQSPELARLSKSIAFYQNVRLLLYVTLASVPEFSSLFLRTGNFGDTWSVIRRSARDAWRKDGHTAGLLRAHGFAADASDAMAFREVLDARDYDSGLTKLNEAWFKATGLTRWTQFMRGLALNVSLDYMKQHAGRVAAGVDPTGDSQRRLDELGLSVDDLRFWAQAGEPVFGEGYNTFEDVRAGRSDFTAEQLEAIQRVTGATTRMINEIVINPTAAQKPLWFSDQRWQLVSQFKSFTYGFMDSILGRVWHELNREGATTWERAAPVLALATMLPVAALGLELRELVTHAMWGKEPRTDGMTGPQYLAELISRTGVLGPAQLALDATEAATFGQDLTTGFLGPTVGQVNNAFRVVGQAEDTSRAVIKTGLTGLPFLSSTPGLRDALTPAVER